MGREEVCEEIYILGPLLLDEALQAVGLLLALQLGSPIYTVYVHLVEVEMSTLSIGHAM